MINFNVPPFTGKEMEYMRQAVENQRSEERRVGKECRL